MSSFPHLPLFTDAFIADTGHLSAQETGAYLMLLMMAWRLPDCRLPDNDDKLARWARVDRRTWLRIKPTVMEFWTLADGSWEQKRLSKERDVVSKRAEVARKNGEQGGRPKPLKDKEAANPAGSSRVPQQKAPIPIPIPNRIEERADPIGSSEPTASPAAIVELDPRRDLFGRGLQIVRKMTGRAEPSCRSLLGKWLGMAQDSAVIVLTTIDLAAESDLANAVPWIEKTIRNEVQRNGSGSHDLFRGGSSGGRSSGTVNSAVSAALARHADRRGLGSGGGADGGRSREPEDHRTRRNDPAIEDADWTPAGRHYAAH